MRWDEQALRKDSSDLGPGLFPLQGLYQPKCCQANSRDNQLRLNFVHLPSFSSSSHSFIYPFELQLDCWILSLNTRRIYAVW